MGSSRIAASSAFSTPSRAWAVASSTPAPTGDGAMTSRVKSRSAQDDRSVLSSPRATSRTTARSLSSGAAADDTAAARSAVATMRSRPASSTAA